MRISGTYKTAFMFAAAAGMLFGSGVMSAVDHMQGARPQEIPATRTAAATNSGDVGSTATVALWEGTICGNAPQSSPAIDVSGSENVTIVLKNIECAGDDEVFITTPVNGYSAVLAALTVQSCQDLATIWQSTVPGLTLDVRCSLATHPSRLAVAVYGRL